MRFKTLKFAATAAILFAASGSPSWSADGAKPWYPTLVATWNERGFAGEETQKQYSPLEKSKITKTWNVCAAFPTLTDAYWLAVNYGLVEQAKEQGFNLQIVEAGGYGNLGKQIQQIEDCSQTADAILFGAISTDGLNPTLDRLHAKGKVLIDLINTVTTPKTTGQTAMSYGLLGSQTGKYLVQASAGRDTTVLWLPGPKGAGWSEDSNKGFTQALAGSRVTIVNTQWGATNKQAQSQLIEDALRANPNLMYIAGNAVAIEAAKPILREKGLTGKIALVADYVTQDVAAGVKDGSVAAMADDAPVLTARLGADQAIRALEKQPFPVHLSPVVRMITKADMSTWDPSTSLAPKGFKAQFTHSVKK
jgi:protein TorT